MEIEGFFTESATGMNWKCPIALNFMERCKNELEQGIAGGLLKYDISVEVEELKKALSYSRDSYKKGFNDGIGICLHYPHVYYWHDPEKDIPPEDTPLLVSYDVDAHRTDPDVKAGKRCGNHYFVFVGGTAFEILASDVTAWMPFPMPWKFKE